MGLKENVIIGKLIPAATGLQAYRTVAVEPAVPIEPRVRKGCSRRRSWPPSWGLTGGYALEGFGPSFAEELEELAQEIETDGSGD